jgi:hypothetical protein
MRSLCEKLFTRYLKPVQGRPNCYHQIGETQVMIESRQWKLAYSPREKVVFDLSDESGLVLEVPGDRGAHLVAWPVIIRVTVHEGVGHF